MTRSRNLADIADYVIVPTSTSSIPLTLKGLGSQTGNLFSVQDSTSADLFYVGPTGRVVSGTLPASPAKFNISTSAAEEVLTITNTTSVNWVQMSMVRNNNATQQVAMKFVPAGTTTGSNPNWYFGMNQGSAAFSIQTWDGTSLLERVTFDTSGYVGIGQTVPVTKLHVKGTWVNGEGIFQVDADSGTQYSGLTFQNNGTVKTYFYHDNTNNLVFLGGTGSQSLVFATNTAGTDNIRMKLDTSGNVQIGNIGDSSLYNSIAAVTKLMVIGSSASTDVLGNTDASIVIANTDDTASNTAALHFGWQDTDATPVYASASIVTVLGTKNAGQYATGTMVFNTSTAVNNAPSEKMRLTNDGMLTLTGARANNTTTGQVRNIYISTSDPTGGNDGDVWIKYT